MMKLKLQELKLPLKVLTQSLIVAGIAIVLLLLFLIGSKSIGNEYIKWLVVASIIVILATTIYRIYLSDHNKKKNVMYKLFSAAIQIFVLLLIILGFCGVLKIFTTSTCDECAVFKAIGIGIVIIWTCVFLVYFIWSIYFYNIRLGITEEEWQRIETAKENKRVGDLYSEDDLKQERNVNPYKDETFGLPTGTVRGMIAFTLLFGALALLVINIGMRDELDSTAQILDQYDFFKKAFLMMIAFYFGDKSLRYLTNNVKDQNNNDENENVSETSSQKVLKVLKSIANNDKKEESEIYDPMQIDDVEEQKKSGKSGTTNQTVSTELYDPMAPNH